MTTSQHQSAFNLVDGEWQSAPEELEVRNPADIREIVATVPSMDARSVHAAFEAAERAAATWRHTSQVDRGRVLLRAAQLLRERRDDLSRTLTLEMGKTLSEASGEVGKAADFFEYYGGLGRAERGSLLSHENPDVMSWTVHEPVGVVLAITPWNDPLLDSGPQARSGADRRKQRRTQAGLRHPRNRDRAGPGAQRRGPASRRTQHRHWCRPEDRCCASRAPGTEGRELHGLERGRRFTEGVPRRS